ncbi:MAG: NAD(P)H-hydrate dehydratase [Puniceicoccaceae bacterium]|nr:NAD(P)H-hydrate dehydratase [Puniceicoccaceae bacterium]
MSENQTPFIREGIIPILSNSNAIELEKTVLINSEEEWRAMQLVGQATAREILKDFKELKPVPENLSVLLLCGKGKNGGDGLLVCDHLLRELPRAKVSVVLLGQRSALNPLTKKALNEVEERVLLHQCPEGLSETKLKALLDSDFGRSQGINLCIDAVLGLGFVPPLKEIVHESVAAMNSCDRIEVRVSIDLPTGVSESDSRPVFAADFTYLAGIPKACVFKGNAHYGRVRFIDIGLINRAKDRGLNFETKLFYADSVFADRLLTLRQANLDKRALGHLFIIGGSRFMPGALMMSVQAAIKSGIGLVTVFAPSSIVPSLAARVPEAMWVSLPENGMGTLSPQAADIVLSQAGLATAMLIGPGLGRNQDTEFFVQKILQEFVQAIVLDADALMPRVIEIIQKGRNASKHIVLTPHFGEFLRMTKMAEVRLEVDALLKIIKNIRATVVLKGAITRISDGKAIYINTRGGPVFSRGGSGDILAGIIGTQLAQKERTPLVAALLGVLIHGLAGESLARQSGQIMVRTTEVIDHLPNVLR